MGIACTPRCEGPEWGAVRTESPDGKGHTGLPRVLSKLRSRLQSEAGLATGMRDRQHRPFRPPRGEGPAPHPFVPGN